MLCKSENCTSCYAGFFLKYEKGICAEGKYNFNLTCYDCDLNCKTCSSGDSLSCLTCICKIGYYLGVLVLAILAIANAWYEKMNNYAWLARQTWF